MVILVCGGRNYSDKARVFDVLEDIHSVERITKLGHGAARGADDLADQWAKYRGVPVDTYPADWKRLGKKAGIVRNQMMLNCLKPDLVLAFPGSRGTADMCNRARKAGVRVFEVSE